MALTPENITTKLRGLSALNAFTRTEEAVHSINPESMSNRGCEPLSLAAIFGLDLVPPGRFYQRVGIQDFIMALPDLIETSGMIADVPSSASHFLSSLEEERCRGALLIVPSGTKDILHMVAIVPAWMPEEKDESHLRRIFNVVDGMHPDVEIFDASEEEVLGYYTQATIHTQKDNPKVYGREVFIFYEPVISGDTP